MNFTREPIIETVISPREGFKLLVRSSKGAAQEEYYVDALEVVSFGHSFFYRSLERSKAFLVPVSDYEVCEVKEMRVALKNAPHERNIKIGGGREASLKREPAEETEGSQDEQESSSELRQAQDRKRGGRNRNRRRRGDDRWEDRRQNPPADGAKEETVREEGSSGEEASSANEAPPAQPFTRLIPPPPTLISQTISRYKDLLPPPIIADQIEAPPKKEEDLPNTESTELFRSSSYMESQQNFHTQRSFLEDNNFLT